jgi:hypothetical protein
MIQENKGKKRFERIKRMFGNLRTKQGEWKMNGNQHLYFYGLWAKCIQALGYIVIVISIFSGSLPFFIVGLIVGIIIIVWGLSKRFDYQRQSGNILHQGDGNW